MMCGASNTANSCANMIAAEGEARLRQQQELYEAVRSERNTYSRSLVEVQVRAGEGGWRAAPTSAAWRRCR